MNNNINKKVTRAHAYRIAKSYSDKLNMPLVIKYPKGSTQFWNDQASQLRFAYINNQRIVIESKNIKNKMAIYIENGIVKLNTIKADVNLKLYSGNVFATVKSTNLKLSTKNGKIEIDDILRKKEVQQTPKYSRHILTISTIKGNIFLATH